MSERMNHDEASSVLDDMVLLFCNSRIGVIQSPKDWGKDFRDWFDEYQYERLALSNLAFMTEIKEWKDALNDPL